MLSRSCILWAGRFSFSFCGLLLSKIVTLTAVSSQFIINLLKLSFLFNQILNFLRKWRSRVFDGKVRIFILEILLNRVRTSLVRVHFHLGIILMTIQLGILHHSNHINLAVWRIRSHHVFFPILTWWRYSTRIIVSYFICHNLVLTLIVSIMLTHDWVTSCSWCYLLKPILLIAIQTSKIVYLSSYWLRQISPIFNYRIFFILLSLINRIIIFHFAFNVTVGFLRK